MKNLIIVLFTIRLFSCIDNIDNPLINTTENKPTATFQTTITNVRVHKDTLSFDVYDKNLITDTFYMGGSPYVFIYNLNTLSNPFLTNINPRFTQPCQGGYGPMICHSYEDGEAYFAIYYTNTVGDTITRYGNLGERMCTMNFIINRNADYIVLNWLREGPERSRIVNRFGVEQVTNFNPLTDIRIFLPNKK